MDLNRSRTFLYISVLTFGISAQLWGAGKLRLDNTTVGPISVAQGANGPTITVNAVNAGDSPLSLAANSSVSWLSASVAKTQSCGTLGAQCNPISISLNTGGLAKGSYTGTVTVSDPNAIDAPQNITVTVLVGGGVPDSLTLYLPANGAPVTQNFSTARTVTTSVNAPGGVSLSVAAPGGGSFATVFNYTLTAKAVGAAPGTYNGSLTVSGSTVGSENKTVPITFNVTSNPIAALSSSAVNFRIAQGAAKQTSYIAASNLSSGTLTLSAPAASTTTGGNWLASSLVSGYVGVTADPTGLQPGTYQGTVTVASNAANNSVPVPVTLTILPSGAPVIQAYGVVNNATYEKGAELGLGELPAIFGDQFTTGDPAAATTLPLPTTLGGASVYVNDQPAPLYYVSANQINFQVPYEAAPGVATVRVDRNGQRGNTVSVTLSKSAPKLLVAVTPDVKVVSTPFGGAATPVTAGSVVTIYALGLGQTSPAVRSGEAAPSSPLANVPGFNNQVYFGNGGLFGKPVSQTPQFIGLSPGFVGLYQINIQVPANTPKGIVPVYLQGDVGTSNQLQFNIQ